MLHILYSMLHAMPIVLILLLFASFMYYFKPFAIFIINHTTCLICIKTCRGNDEIGYVEREETLAIEASRIMLWQHKCLADCAIGIDMTEIGACVETVVAA